MITLITGNTGTGKTAMGIDLMLTELADRPLYVSGIQELKVPHTMLSNPTTWTTWIEDESSLDGKKLVFSAWPVQAAILIDECQRTFAPRHSSAKVPDHVAAFETHRHEGIDFYLFTQHPSFIDHHVRKLVKRHIHIRDVGVLGRWKYQWPECCDNPDKDYKTAPITLKYKLPKRVLGLYKSAEAHTKMPRKMPPAFVFLGLAACGAAYYGWGLYQSLTGNIKGAPAPAVGASAPARAGANPSGQAVVPTSPAALVASFTPRVSWMPESAPAYDHLRVVKAMPKVVGGFCYVGGACRCWTQQATDAGIGEQACREFVAKPRFDPYREPDAPREQPKQASQAASSAPYY